MKLFNSLTRKKEEFKSIEPNKVTMYSCGPTVYNYFHIGNARPFIIFDTLRNYLEYRGYEVKFVQNFTDIDDKLINKAKEENTTVENVAKKYIEEYFIDAKGLGIREASVHPKATENIEEIIGLIKKLEERGYTYVVSGDVYFKTRKFEGYGKLSHQDINDLEVGNRVSVDERKEDPTDFVLWKAKKPGEPFWESPWGEGRPGWHIECSAMANRFLGETIDIHSGGQDLIFPHHENEIAQSEAAHGKPFANYWLHNGFINVNNEKMSKSLGNFFTVRDIVKHFDYRVVRFFMISSHYRNPINFSFELLESAKNSLERIDNCLDNINYLLSNSDVPEKGKDTQFEKSIEEKKNQFIVAMDDDLNTADAISAIFDMVRIANNKFVVYKTYTKEELSLVKDNIQELCNVLRILKDKDEGLEKEIEDLINKRQEARANKDWNTADRIRDELKMKGIVLEDTPNGVKWKKV
ncbi:MAG: cysteine--tRNA ligase [Clostridiales bacterium]|nr:cysteine--tRNA ligase [Clostridiales bacterium]